MAMKIVGRVSRRSFSTMATIRKRTAKTLPPGEVPRGLKDTTAADDANGAAIAKPRKKAAAGAAAIRELTPKPFDEQRIRDRAYAIWVAEGRPHGRELEHWLRAQGEMAREAA
jgi:Protein of unknown function (DUF2934)